MKLGLVAVHHPRDGHREDVVDRVRLALAVAGGVDVSYDDREQRPREVFRLAIP